MKYIFSKKHTLKLFYFIFVISLIFSSCNNESSDLPFSPEPTTRNVFGNKEEFNSFMDNKNIEMGYTTSNYSPDQELTIIESFKEFTSIGSILDKNLEFQIGNIIYKYGESGYTIYLIQDSKYNEALSFVRKEKNIINNITSYKTLPDGGFQIAEGIELFYDGDPIITVERQNQPLLRVAADGRTKVQTSFWTTKGPLRSSCGVRVEAWSRSNTSSNWESAKTDLTLEYNVQVKIPILPVPQPFHNGFSTKVPNNKIEITLDWVAEYCSYKMEKGSIIGRAKCWDNTWITATVNK